MKIAPAIVTQEYLDNYLGGREDCFHCHARLGEEHREGSVCRRRTIVIEFKAEMVVDVPEYYTEEQIRFFYNDSTSCKSNLLDQLQREDDAVGEDECFTCHRAEVKYLREAEPNDIEQLVPESLQNEVLGIAK